MTFDSGSGPAEPCPHLSSLLWPGEALRAKRCDWLAFSIGKAEPDEIKADRGYQSGRGSFIAEWIRLLIVN
jgi:hypothetical protein